MKRALMVLLSLVSCFFLVTLGPTSKRELKAFRSATRWKPFGSGCSRVSHL